MHWDSWNQDLAFFTATVKSSHSFSSIENQTHFEQQVANFSAELPSLDDQETVIGLVKLVNHVEDRFTLTWGEIGYGFDQTFPFRLTQFDEGLYVTEATHQYKDLLGMQLVEIGDYGIQEVTSLCDGVLGSDCVTILTNPGVLYGLHVLERVADGHFVFKGLDGELFLINLPAVDADGVTWISKPQSLLRSPLPKAVNYWFSYLAYEQILYVQMNRCETMEGLFFEDFISDLVYEADRQPVRQLVLDLRSNRGGRDALCEMLFAGLYRYVISSPGVQFYVLVGTETSSRGWQIAVQLQKYTKALIVSSQDGLFVDTLTQQDRFSLPYSKMYLWYVKGNVPPLSSEFKPDLVLSPKIEGYLNGSDPMLAAIQAFDSTTSRSKTTPLPYPGELPALTGTPRTQVWREDLQALVEELQTLPDIHGDRFDIVEDPGFMQAVSDLDASVSALEDQKIVVGMMGILAMLEDAHTRIPHWDWQTFNQYAYPIQVQWFSDGLFVTSVQPGYEALLGRQIIKIGSMSSDYILDELEQVVPHENPYGLRAFSEDYVVNPVVLYALGVVTDLKAARLVFRDRIGREETRYLIAQPSEDSVDWIPALPRNRQPLYLQRSQDVYYWYKYLEEAQTFYFQYTVCGEMPTVPFWSFMRDMFASMRGIGSQRLIIDLRRNGGGRPEGLGFILANLKSNPQFAQHGRLFVLIGNETFSSAVHLAALIRNRTEAIFVGEPTAQGPNFYATPKMFTLPNSGVTVQYSLSYWETAEEDALAIEPDVWVELSSGDYFAGRDPVLERVLEIP